MRLLVAESPGLAPLATLASSALLARLSVAVVQRYSRTLKQYVEFHDRHGITSRPFPARPAVVLLRCQEVFSNTNSGRSCRTVVHAVNWLHRCLDHAPLDSPALKVALDGFDKRGARRVSHTALITSEQLASLLQVACSSTALTRRRTTAIIATMTATGLRKVDVLRLCGMDILRFEDRVTCFIALTKNDQLRVGSFRTIARTGGPFCFATILLNWIDSTLPTGMSHQDPRFLGAPIFRASQFRAGTVQLVPPRIGGAPISASSVNADFRAICREAKLPPMVTMHSLRVHMASVTANKDSVALAKVAGGWRSQSVLTYVEPADAQLLRPSMLVAEELAAAAAPPTTPVSLAAAAAEEAADLEPGELVIDPVSSKATRWA